MPDDSRPSRPPRAAAAPLVAPPDAIDDSADRPSFPCGDPSCSYCESLLAGFRQQIQDIDEGRDPGMPLEEFMALLRTPLSPEELAELDQYDD